MTVVPLWFEHLIFSSPDNLLPKFNSWFVSTSPVVVIMQLFWTCQGYRQHLVTIDSRKVYKFCKIWLFETLKYHQIWSSNFFVIIGSVFLFVCFKNGSVSIMFPFFTLYFNLHSFRPMEKVNWLPSLNVWWAQVLSENCAQRPPKLHHGQWNHWALNPKTQHYRSHHASIRTKCLLKPTHVIL